MMPKALFGFPGVSPQADDTDWCEASDKFLQEARSSVLAADFLCVHSYWQARGSGHWQMEGEDFGGWYWKRVQRAFPAKKLCLSEYSCNAAGVSDADKGAMYRDYLNGLSGVEMAFAFCLSEWGLDLNHEGWVRNGAVTDIARTIAA